MPRARRNYRMREYTGPRRQDWNDIFGPPPYFILDQSYGNEWDAVCYLGVDQLPELHKAMGAILAKRAHDAR